MKRWAYLTAAVLFYLTRTTDAAPPSGAAAGLYLVEYPRALFAFRVDPWSDGLHAIRGIGRGTFGENDEYDVFFEIRGVYRPQMAHTAQGMFLYRGTDYVKHVPWKGMFDPQQQKFQWAIVHGGEVHLLLQPEPPTDELRTALALQRKTMQEARATAVAPARALATTAVPADTPTTTGAAPPSNSTGGVANIATGNPARTDSPASPTNAPNAAGTANATVPKSTTSPSAEAPAKQPTGSDSSQVTGLFAEYNDFLPKEWQDGELGIDFPKAIIHVVSFSPESANARDPAAAKSKPPTTPQPVADTLAQARREIKLAENLDILDKITNEMSGNGDAGNDPYAEAVKKILKEDASRSGGPREAIRKRAEVSSTDSQRVLRRLQKPNALGPGSLPKDEPAPRSTSTTIFFNPSMPTMPNVVGLSIEGAVTALWEAGLTPRSVECLGQSTDPAKADRVTQQIPAAGSPSPADGNVSLQWYSKPTDAPVPTPGQAVETKPAEPTTTSTPTVMAGGFQPGDGAKVEERFAGAEIYAGGKGIAFASGGAGGGMNWLIGKLDEPLFQVGIANAKESVQRISQTRNSGKAVVTIAQSGPRVIDLSINNGDGSGGSTYCYQYQEYRGFFINYAEMVNTSGAALGAKVAAGIEKSKQLIDLRFPK